jgi:hypothetical protein
MKISKLEGTSARSTTISRLEYVKMQVSLLAGAFADPSCVSISSHEMFKKQVDIILDLNGITVNDEPEVKPMTQDEFVDLMSEAEIFRGREILHSELKKRGLVIA